MTQPTPAMDPGRYAGVVESSRVTPHASGAGSFAVDMEQAPAAIRDLEEAARLLGNLRLDAVQLGRIVPPAADAVSHDAALMLEAAAVGGSGSFVAALDAGLHRLQELTESIRRELGDYGESDARSADSIRANRA